MDNNNEKTVLNDGVLDKVSGGNEIAGSMIEICRYCGRAIRNGNIMDHDQNCFVVMTRQHQPF
ncbi:MAG: hypothetical protein IJM42_00895 [Synergistes sp.]|nr:hypothetical protein [Synergistes sp.]